MASTYLCLCFFWSAAAVHPAVAEPVPSSQCGCLIRYTCDSAKDLPFDPHKLTIVITHGWNPAANCVHLTTPEVYARSILARCGNSVNVLGWDWNRATFPTFRCRQNSLNAICRGKQLAAELQRLGVRPEKTWLIGHSLGALLMASTAREMAQCGTPIARLTMLDAVWAHHRFIFGPLRAQCNACCVENYWAALPSGVGGPARWPCVYNRFIRGASPVRGTINPLRGNHLYVIEWYYNTIRCPGIPDGFNR